MGDFVHMPGSGKNIGKLNGRLTKSWLRTSSQRITSNGTFKRFKNLQLQQGTSSQIILFLLEVVTLDIIRRVSNRVCPFVWHGLQALQLLAYPPFKWIQRWTCFRNFVKGIQIFSRPMMFLSVATALSDHSESSKEISDDADDALPLQSVITQPIESFSRISNETAGNTATGNWLLQLRKDLEHQGEILPERINDEELLRFHTAVDGNFSCLLKSIRRTIRWRETYHILSLEELEIWSPLVFWHGTDVELRPCLIVRFGLACSTIAPHNRPRFSQAVVSQIEHGVLRLVNEDVPRITVLVDCEGLSPIRFPVQMMRTCFTLMQDHYPNRLATLFVIRLPPLSRVLVQTFIQVLRPKTQQKLRIEGAKTYQEVLSRLLQSVPTFLGGKCTCSRCCDLLVVKNQEQIEEDNVGDPGLNFGYELDDASHEVTTDPDIRNHEQVSRGLVLGMLVLWLFVAFLVGMHGNLSLSTK